MSEQSHPMERRLVVRLLQYWRGLSDDEDSMPSESDIDPKAIPDMWPNCVLLDVAGKETDPEIIYIGSELASRADADVSGKKLSATPAKTLVSESLSYYGQVLAKRVPITFGGEFIDSRGVKILYRSIILPLSADGNGINRLLGAANCREVVSD